MFASCFTHTSTPTVPLWNARSTTVGSGLRVLFLRNIAGVPSILSDALADLDIYAKVLDFKPSIYGFKPDYLLTIDTSWSRPKRYFETFSHILKKDLLSFHVFHFNFGKSFIRSKADILALRMLKKHVVAHYHGSDVRTLNLQSSPFMRDFCDLKIVSTPDLLSSVDDSIWLPNPCRPPSRVHGPTEKENRDKIRIGHFPTNPMIKGTNTIIAAITKVAGEDYEQSMQKPGIFQINSSRFQFLLVQSRPHEEALSLMDSCDVVIDQVNELGTYGNVSIEAMSRGKLVICSVDESLYPDRPPILKASADDLVEILESVIEGFESYQELRNRGRTYYESFHSPRVTAVTLLKLYEEAGIC